MTQETPWSELLRLSEAGNEAALQGFLEQLSPRDALHAFSRLDVEDQRKILTVLSPESAAEIVDDLPDSQAAELLEQLTPQDAAAIIDELPSDEQADLLQELDWADAEEILEHLPTIAEEVRQLAQYPHDVAGGLMIREYLSYVDEQTVASVISDINKNAEQYADYSVQYIYVVDSERRLVGVLQIRSLLLHAPTTKLAKIMLATPLAVTAMTPLDELEAFFDSHPFFGVPVTDVDGKLLGIVRRNAISQALAERAGSDLMKTQGIASGDELRSMSLRARSVGRLAWLSINIVLNLVGASIIALYQDTLSAAITLAVFLPIISDMSGCSGNQAVGVSMRELALGVIRPTEIWRVMKKELWLGMINGIALGMLLAGIAWLWRGNFYLGVVVGLALALNTVVAVLMGGSIPLLLKRFGKDPALASGPILTTVTDMCGFFLLFFIAQQMIDRIVP